MAAAAFAVGSGLRDRGGDRKPRRLLPDHQLRPPRQPLESSQPRVGADHGEARHAARRRCPASEDRRDPPAPARSRGLAARVTDVIVIGLGADGSAAAAHLARRGVTVLGLEAFPRGHTNGSSGGLTRVIRLAYYEHPDYVPLLKRAWTLWRELEASTGEVLLRQTGGVYAGPRDGELVGGALRSAREHLLEPGPPDPAALHPRLPPFRSYQGGAGPAGAPPAD